MLFVHAAARKGITRYGAVMNGVGIAACTEYCYQGRTFKHFELLEVSYGYD